MTVHQEEFPFARRPVKTAPEATLHASFGTLRPA
ncbi:hypothetical protein TMRH483_00040 [Qipengyuania sp. 483]